MWRSPLVIVALMGTISCVAQEAQDRGARDTFDSVGTEVVALEVIADLLRDTQLDLADIADIETGDCLPGVSTGNHRFQCLQCQPSPIACP